MEVSRRGEKTYLLTCAPNEDSDQTAHPRSLIRVSVVRMKKLCLFGYPKCAQWRFWSDCANAQADLNLLWVHMSEDMLFFFFSRCGSKVPYSELHALKFTSAYAQLVIMVYRSYKGHTFCSVHVLQRLFVFCFVFFFNLPALANCTLYAAWSGYALTEIV